MHTGWGCTLGGGAGTMRLRGGKCGMAINDRGGWSFDGEVPEAKVCESVCV